MYRTFYLQRKNLRLNIAKQLVKMSSKKRASQKDKKGVGLRLTRRLTNKHPLMWETAIPAVQPLSLTNHPIPNSYPTTPTQPATYQ